MITPKAVYSPVLFLLYYLARAKGVNEDVKHSFGHGGSPLNLKFRGGGRNNGTLTTNTIKRQKAGTKHNPHDAIDVMVNLIR